MIARICFIVTALWTVGVTAFTPTLTTTHNTIGMTQSNFKFQQAHVVPSCNRINKITIRNLSSAEPESESTSDAATTTTKQSADGTFYDDEVTYCFRVVLHQIITKNNSHFNVQYKTSFSPFLNF